MKLLSLLGFTLTLFLAGCAQTPTKPTIESKYDPYSEVKMVSVGSFDIAPGLKWDISKGTSEGETSYLVYFQRNGAYDSPGSEWKFLKHHHLYFLVDGKSLDAGPGTHEGDVNSTSSGYPYITESMSYVVSKGFIKRLGEASNLSGRIGSQEFDVTDEQLEILKIFIRKHL